MVFSRNLYIPDRLLLLDNRFGEDFVIDVVDCFVDGGESFLRLLDGEEELFEEDLFLGLLVFIMFRFLPDAVVVASVFAILFCSSIEKSFSQNKKLSKNVSKIYFFIILIVMPIYISNAL